MAFDTSYNVIYWNLYRLGGQPLLSRHYSILRGCPLNTGFTVPCIFHHMGRENQEGKEPCFSDTFNTFWRHRQHDWPGQAVWIGTGSLWLEEARSRLLCSRPMMMIVQLVKKTRFNDKFSLRQVLCSNLSIKKKMHEYCLQFSWFAFFWKVKNAEFGQL